MPNILCQFEDVNSMAGLVEKNQGIAIVTDSQALRNYNVTKLELDTPYSAEWLYGVCAESVSACLRWKNSRITPFSGQRQRNKQTGFKGRK